MKTHQPGRKKKPKKLTQEEKMAKRKQMIKEAKKLRKEAERYARQMSPFAEIHAEYRINREIQRNPQLYVNISFKLDNFNIFSVNINY